MIDYADAQTTNASVWSDLVGMINSVGTSWSNGASLKTLEVTDVLNKSSFACGITGFTFTAYHSRQRRDVFDTVADTIVAQVEETVETAAANGDGSIVSQSLDLTSDDFSDPVITEV